MCGVRCHMCGVQAESHTDILVYERTVVINTAVIKIRFE